MTKILKTEFKRAIYNKNFAIILAIGSILSVLSIIFDVLAGRLDYIMGNVNFTPFMQWIGENSNGTYKLTFFMIIPILAIVPYADSYWMDKYSGFAKNIYARTSKNQYIISKIIATFTTGGLVVVIPMILNIYLLFLILPSYHPGLFENFKLAKTMFASLFYFHPYMYIVAYIVLNFLFGGLFACIGLAISPFCKLRFLITTIPYILYISTFLLGALGLPKLCPFYFLQSSSIATNITFMPIAIIFVVSIIVTIGAFIIGVKKDEII